MSVDLSYNGMVADIFFCGRHRAYLFDFFCVSDDGGIVVSTPQRQDFLLAILLDDHCRRFFGVAACIAWRCPL